MTERKFLPTAELVAFVVAQIAAVVRRRCAQGQRTLLMTCAGRTPQAIYQSLAAAGLTNAEWSTLHFGETDEFAPSAERKNTNAADLEQMFFGHAVTTGLIPRGNLHWFDPATDWSLSIPRYEEELLGISGAINIVLLGAGGGPYWPGGAVDPGHVAGIMPGHPELWIGSERFGIVEDSPKPPKRRMTMTPFAIQNATDLVLGVITGMEKAGSVANYLAPTVDPVHCPVKVIDGARAPSFFVTNVRISEA